MAVLVTGSSGFLGKALTYRLTGARHKVYGLSRHPLSGENLMPLTGDITQPNLGLKSVPSDITMCYHLAAIHRLGENQAEEIWETNVGGTANVIEFCKKYEIPRLAFVSSAYTFARNSYEKSKMVCESLVLNSGIPRKTIFKPSVIMPSEGIAYPGHFLQFVLLVVKLHKRAEAIRQVVEGKMRLPVIRPVFRVPGNPDGTLNLIKIDDVAKVMAEIEDEGTFWLTNPNPPRLGELATWVGESILLDLRIEPKFKPTPIEATFQKMAKAFGPYLFGDDFPTDLTQAQPINREFIHNTIKMTLLG